MRVGIDRLRRGSTSEATPRSASLTSAWFDSAGLEEIVGRYVSFPVERLGYATVKDYVDSFEHINPLACAQGDLKDVQRPWTFKAILASIPRGGRLLEIGAGQPFVADL